MFNNFNELLALKKISDSNWSSLENFENIPFQGKTEKSSKKQSRDNLEPGIDDNITKKLKIAKIESSQKSKKFLRPEPQVDDYQPTKALSVVDDIETRFMRRA